MIQKNTLLAAISFFSILCSAQTQVGINTTDPKATLDIAAKTDGSSGQGLDASGGFDAARKH